MGNTYAGAKLINDGAISCFKFKGVPLLIIAKPTIKLILCEGSTRVLKHRRKIKAGEIMFQFPDSVICHADSFFLGRPIPILAIHDHLVAGNSYFILPLDRLPPPEGPGGGVLSAASLSSLGSSPSSPARRTPPLVNICGGSNDFKGPCYNNKGPFEYIKDRDGRVHMIKVVPEFIAKIIASNFGGSSPSGGNNKLICSTPELQKQYEQLVRAKDQAWSPKLETISEHKIRFSPCRFIGLEWKQKEKASAC